MPKHLTGHGPALSEAQLFRAYRGVVAPVGVEICRDCGHPVDGEHDRRAEDSVCDACRRLGGPCAKTDPIEA